jgi:hypothetical protein
VSSVQRAVRAGVLAAALATSVAGVLAGCAGGEITGPPEKEESPGVVSLVAAESAPADGATQVRIVAVVDSALARDQRSVTFRTSAGTFPGGREVVVAADSARTAVAVLTAPPDTMTAVITATAGGGTRRIEVRFVVALPDLIEVTTDQPSVTSGFTGSLTVTAALRRNPGVPTAGHVVAFEAHAPGEPQPHGRFSSETGLSDAAGRVSVRFTPADSVYAGPVVIVATAVGRTGVLRDSTVVQVVPPC